MTPKKVMHSFKIEKDLIERAKKEAKSQSMATSVFIRQAIIEKLEKKKKLEELEERIKKLEEK
ncbi:MAG: hypothetical protein R6U35_08815 [Candidatus Humimicrobiaceae bacterium]